MVDVRPLLFANALFLMLLITAGFAQFSTSDTTSASSIPTTDVNTAKADERQELATSNTPEPNTSIEQKDQESTPAEISDEDIFADTNSTIPDTRNTPPSGDTSEIAAKAASEAKNVKEALPEVKVATTPKVAPAPKPVQKPKPIPKTGKLVVRSNVSGDTVLIDGKPYGPTKMEVDLVPGNYNIEVAKNGYTSWTTNVTVARGTNQTLKARLEHYTTVDYRNGEWINGVTTGEGSYVADDGTSYQGGFINGKFHGFGSIRYPDGTDYRGEWFEGAMQGEGTLHTNQGDTYIGSFKNGEFNGEGTLTKSNSDIYSGYWVSGTLNGQGSLTTKDGLLFVGGFSDNQFHGEGSLTYPDGRHYEGTFSKGQFHGKGIEIYANGKKYVGQFMEGSYHGKGELMNPNGSKITGTFKFGQPFGKATLTTPEGEIFTARTTEPGVCYRLKSYRATQCPPMEGW